jgi:hypothetical protein
MAMYPVDKILGALVMIIKMLNDNSGIFGVLVAAAAAFIAYKQLWAWREEATGKIKYQVALNYRRTLLQLQDEIRDLRHPTTRPDETIIHSDVNMSRFQMQVHPKKSGSPTVGERA